MVIHTEKLSGTASAGTFAVNTISNLCGLLRTIIIKPTTATTQYDITITNSDSMDIYSSKSIVGNSSDEVQIPLRGIFTITITNSTADEAFTIHLALQERW